MKAGAVDYVQKPYDISALIARLQRAINERVGLAEKISWPELAMVSAGMLDLGRRLERLAAINVSALIVGESGSGKEIVARHTHRLPPAPTKPSSLSGAAAWQARTRKGCCSVRRYDPPQTATMYEWAPSSTPAEARSFSTKSPNCRQAYRVS